MSACVLLNDVRDISEACCEMGIGFSSLTHRGLLHPNSKRNNALSRGLTTTAAATTIICKSYPSELVKKSTYPARILPDSLNCLLKSLWRLREIVC